MAAYRRKEFKVVVRNKEYIMVANPRFGYQHFFNRKYGEDRDFTLVAPHTGRRWRGVIPYKILDENVQGEYLRIRMNPDGSPTGKYAKYFSEQLAGEI